MNRSELSRTDKERLLQAEREAADALAARDAAQVRLDRANRAVEAWRVINSLSEDAPTSEEKATGEKVQPPIIPPSAQAESFNGNKSSWVRQMVLRFRNEGIAPARLRQIARTVGIAVTPQFPYTTLYNLKQAGKVREEDGRYFPAALD